MNKAAELEKLAQEIIDKKICPGLAKTANKLVMGGGSSDAHIVFVGEAPGAKEDQTGLPFIGAAGKFLDQLLEGIGLDRADAYITSIVKYRPPGNRDPKPSEIADFVPYLDRQIDIINPKLIVFLGRHAMNVYLPELRISEAHGKVVEQDGRVYLPLYHPAAALYNGSMRATLHEDFAQIPKILKKL